MANYQDWNNEIYNYFFKADTVSNSTFFSVNKNVIDIIGQEMGVKNPIDSFCRCVLNLITDKNRIYLNGLSTSINNNNVPYQTAVIAFFILAASTIEDGKLSSSAYWNRVSELSKNICADLVPRPPQSEKEGYFKMFNKFSVHISKTFNINFEFKRLFNRQGDDWIGLPISQAMITGSDICILYNKFDKSTPLNDKIIQNIMDDNKYSKIFKKIRDSGDKEIIEKLKDRIKELYDNWDGYKYEIVGNQIQRIPKLYYEKYMNSLNFYEILKKTRCQEDCICINGRTYKKTDDEYCAKIHKEDIRLRSEYILLKKGLHENVGFEETSGANVGDNISIIASHSFFRKHKEELFEISNGSSEYNLTDQLCIMENIICHCVSEYFNIKDADKILFKKGLKQGYEDKYLKGAAPLMYLYKKSGQTNAIEYSIDNKDFEKYYMDKPVDLNKYSEINFTHIIKTNNENEKCYQILDKIEGREEKPIYQYFNEHLELIKQDYIDDNKNIINGCNIYNLSLSDHPSVVNERKKQYINFIINALDKKFNNAESYNPKWYGIKQKYLKELEV